MLELYHWEPNTFFLKPLIALEEKGVEFRSRYIDATSLEQFGAEIPANAESRLQLEREGPVLVHDGTLISSSFFLLEYIAETFPGPTLLPADVYDRYRMRAWGQQIALSLASVVTMLGCARYLAPTLRARPAADLRARIASIEPLERRAAWAALLEADQASAVGAALARLGLAVERIEAALGAGSWLAGPDYSIADIDAYAMLRALPALAPDQVNAAATPRILDFLARMGARPAVRAALAYSRSGRPEEAFVPGPEPSRWG
jgi:GSH-dependent disulfide-bond oxidoreductase